MAVENKQKFLLAAWDILYFNLICSNILLVGKVKWKGDYGAIGWLPRQLAGYSSFCNWRFSIGGHWCMTWESEHLIERETPLKKYQILFLVRTG